MIGLKKLLVCILVLLLMAGFCITSGCAKDERGQKEPTEKTKQEASQDEKKDESAEGEASFVLESAAFGNNADIPVKYANTGVSGGQNISIPLFWKNAPGGTRSFVVVMIDRHKIANNWVHWLVINIPGDVDSISEGTSSSTKMPEGAIELDNTSGSSGYGGPQPPPGSGAHNYEITVYALSVENIDLTGEVTASGLEQDLKGKTLASAKLVGKLER